MYLVCGEALFDFFSEEDASGLASKVNYTSIAGGSPFNVAVGLRRLGIEAGLFGGVSTDFLGRRLVQGQFAGEFTQRLPFAQAIAPDQRIQSQLALVEAQGEFFRAQRPLPLPVGIGVIPVGHRVSPWNQC